MLIISSNITIAEYTVKHKELLPVQKTLPSIKDKESALMMVGRSDIRTQGGDKSGLITARDNLFVSSRRAPFYRIALQTCIFALLRNLRQFNFRYHCEDQEFVNR